MATALTWPSASPPPPHDINNTKIQLGPLFTLFCSNSAYGFALLFPIFVCTFKYVFGICE